MKFFENESISTPFLCNCIPESAWHSSWTIWPLIMGPIGFPETSVTINLHCVTFQQTQDFIYTTKTGNTSPDLLSLIPQQFSCCAPYCTQAVSSVLLSKWVSLSVIVILTLGRVSSLLTHGSLLRRAASEFQLTLVHTSCLAVHPFQYATCCLTLNVLVT